MPSRHIIHWETCKRRVTKVKMFTSIFLAMQPKSGLPRPRDGEIPSHVLAKKFPSRRLDQHTGFGVLSMIYVGFKPCSEARLASQIEIYTQSCTPRSLPYPTLHNTHGK